MKRNIIVFGKRVTLELHEPTNEEYNAYSNATRRAIKDNDEEGLIAVRAKQFDAWVTEVTGMDKTAIPDRLKSSAMFQIYEFVEVDEKN